MGSAIGCLSTMNTNQLSMVENIQNIVNKFYDYIWIQKYDKDIKDHVSV